MSKFIFNSNSIVYVNGKLDVEATTEAFQAALISWENETGERLANVRDACVSAFDGYAPGTRIPKPLVVQIAMMRLNATPDTWRELEEDISSVLADTSTFDVARGRSGGVMLIRR